MREKTGDVVRTAFAVHTYHPVFEALVHHPRFVEPAEQFLRDRTYIHQFKINGKPPSTATSGSGTRTTAPGRPTTTCPRRAP